MARNMLTGNAAAAWGARLAEVDYVPAFPITPQTEIIETIARWSQTGAIKTRLVTMDSEHSMLAAAGAAAATGVRVFTATSSQGLVYGFEMLYAIAGLRVPLVLVNVSRALSHPITLEPDHNDVLAARDTGFLQIHAETCQEVLDSILLAYRLAENPAVRLPAIVNLDGFYLSFTREVIDVPDPDQARRFLPAYQRSYPCLGASAPIALGAAVLDPCQYTYFKFRAHQAAQSVLQLHREVAEEFSDVFGRRYELVEPYMLDDADYAIVMTNSFASIGKAEIKRLRARGKKVGLLRPRLIRPFPHEEIQRLLGGRKAVAVIDQNISLGKGGVLFSEIASALYNRSDRPPLLLSFIGGLGGRRFHSSEFDWIISLLEAGPEGTKDAGQPRLLFSAEEYGDVKRSLAQAYGENQDNEA